MEIQNIIKKKNLLLTIISCILLLLLILLIPLVDGFWFKRHYFRLIENINQSEDRFNITIENYHLGWFRSDAVIKIQNKLASSQIPSHIKIEQTITHGPLVRDKIENKIVLAMASIQNTLHLTDYIEKAILGKEASKGVLQINTLVYFNGEYMTKLNTPPFTFSFIPKNYFTWQGLSGSLYFKVGNNMIQKARTEITIGGFSAESEFFDKFPEMQIATDPIIIQSDSTLEPIGLWTSHSEISIPRIVIQSKSAIVTLINNLTIAYTTNVDTNGMYHLSQKMNLAKLDIPKWFFAQIAPASFSLSANQFNAQALAELTTYSRSDDVKKLSPEQKKQTYSALIAKTITPASQVNADLTLSTSSGIFLINGQLYWPNQIPLPQSMNSIYKNVSMRITARMAASLINQLIIEYLLPPESRNAAIAPPTTTPRPQIGPTPKEIFNRKLAELVQQGELPTTIAMQLIGIRDQNLSEDEFNTQVKNFRLSPNASTIITDAYKEQKTQEITMQTKEQPSTSIDPKQTIINQWLEKGYIVQSGSDYLMEITSENGILKVNGKVVTNLPTFLPMK